ncbi:hypothetical protein EMN47_18980 [Prolixibacteraceae bacterium JC049]|nr:hypothetical protein [Prolixibacteraceae bacterium JC049]
MKKWIFIGMVMVAALFTACNEEDEVIYIFSYSEILEHSIDNMLEGETFGVDQQIKFATEVVEKSLSSPAPEYNDSKEAIYNGSFSTYSYNVDYSGVQMDSEIAFTSMAEGAYETPLMTSKDNFSNTWTLSEIAVDSDFYRITGTSTRNGNQYSKTYKDSFDSEITFTIEQLEVNRVTGNIKSGTVQFNFKGTSSYGEAYTKTGTVQYSDYQSVVNYN